MTLDVLLHWAEPASSSVGRLQGPPVSCRQAGVVAVLVTSASAVAAQSVFGGCICSVK